MPDLERLSELELEELARRVDRRIFLKRALHTGFSLMVGAALWSLPAARAVIAAGCMCGPPGGTYCVGCPTDSTGGCPTECDICVLGECAGCIYPSGHWTSGGCGTCGNGSVQCYDCNCGRPGHCSTCGCKSACFCCNCCSPQDIAHELELARATR